MCPFQMHYTVGPVPRNFYYDPSTDKTDYDEITVYAGDKHIIELEVNEPGALIQ